MSENSFDRETPIAIDFGDVHLWLNFHEECAEHPINQHFLSILSEDELAQHSRFHFASDRYRYLLTRALVRSVLSRYSLVEPKEWRFSKTSYGRPYVVGPGQAAIEKLTFNISHTKDLIVMGVSNGVDIGVDAENTERGLMLGIADRVFSHTETAAMEALPPGLRHERFFALWTLKESYVKAHGMGLQLPLKHINFAIDSSPDIHVYFDDAINDAPDRWKFLQLDPSDKHVVAICVEQPISGAPKLTCRSCVPLSWERICDLVPARKSP